MKLRRRMMRIAARLQALGLPRHSEHVASARTLQDAAEALVLALCMVRQTAAKGELGQEASAQAWLVCAEITEASRLLPKAHHEELTSAPIG